MAPKGDHDTVTAPAAESPATAISPAIGGPNGVPVVADEVHDASAGYASLRALTLTCTMLPLSSGPESVPHTLAVHAPEAETSLETPPTVTTYDRTALPEPAETGAHSTRRRPSRGSARSPAGAGGITSDQIAPGTSTASENPIPFWARTRTRTPLA